MSSSEPSPQAPSLVSETVSSYRVGFKTLVLPLFVSFLALAAIGYFTYEPGMFTQIGQMFKPTILALACLVLTIRVLTGGFRLRYASRNHLSLSQALRIQVIWDFYANVTPSVIGGAPFAALYMNRDAKIPVGEASAIMIFMMLLDQVWFALSIPVMLFASFFIEVIPASVGSVGKGAITVYFLGLMTWVGLFAYATLVKPAFLQKVFGKLLSIGFLKRFKPRVDQEMASMQNRAAFIRQQPPRFFLMGLFFTIIIWACRYVLLLFVVMSITDVTEPVTIIFRAMAILLSYIIMPTPGGAGGIEAAYAVFMTPLIGHAAVAPTLFMWRFIGFYIFIFLGAFLTTQKLGESKPQTTIS